MDLNDYLRALRQHWVGALLITLLCGAVAFGYYSTQPKVYAADANGFIGTGAADDVSKGMLNDSLAKSRVKSYADIATGRATAEAVAEDLGLKGSPAGLVSQITVAQPPDTVLLKITARASTPRGAQELADAWVRALAEQVKELEAPGKEKTPDGVPRVVPVESAALPTSPVAPRVNRNTVIGLVLGALLALGYAVAASFFDRRIRSAADIEALTSVPVVGTIPDVASLRNRRSGVDDPAAGEAFRKLRTNLMYMDVDNPPRVLVITSAKPGDGKSTVATHIASTLERSGKDVVLIDADLRRPTLAERFGLDPAVGLTTVLTGQLALEDVLQEDADRPRLRLLTAGPIPPNPSELLGSQAMRRLIHSFPDDTYVVLDAPPLLVTDAAILSTAADGAFVVVGAGKTVDTEFKGAMAALDHVHGRALGIIVNRVSRRAGSGYGYEYSYGGYEAAAEDGSASGPEKRPKQRGRRTKGRRVA